MKLTLWLILISASLTLLPRPLPVASANGNVKFVDVTEAAGIRFRHVSAPEKKYIVESMSGGVALFDFDNDGVFDVVDSTSSTVTVPELILSRVIRFARFRLRFRKDQRLLCLLPMVERFMI